MGKRDAHRCWAGVTHSLDTVLWVFCQQKESHIIDKCLLQISGSVPIPTLPIPLSILCKMCKKCVDVFFHTELYSTTKYIVVCSMSGTKQVPNTIQEC